VSRLIS